MKDIVVIAGSTPWSVLSLCQNAFNYKARTFVVCINNGFGGIYGRSKYVTKSFDIPSTDINSFWNSFFETYSFNEKPILYTTFDNSCLLVNENRDFYNQNFELCLPSDYVLKSFLDKDKAAIEAVAHGLTIPKTIGIRTIEDVDKLEDEFKSAVIIKPATSKDHVKAAFKTKIFDNAVDASFFVKQYVAKGIKLQCQEYIVGKDKDCVFYQFYRSGEGEVTECMGEKTIQYNGIMAMGTTRFDEDLAKMCRSFIASINYIGIGGIEFKKYRGKYYFIEMSTRTEGFLPISDFSGVSLAEASYRCMNGLSMNIQNQKDNVVYVVVSQWMKALVKKFGLYELTKGLFGIIFNKNYISIERYFGLRMR